MIVVFLNEALVAFLCFFIGGTLYPSQPATTFSAAGVLPRIILGSLITLKFGRSNGGFNVDTGLMA